MCGEASVGREVDDPAAALESPAAAAMRAGISAVGQHDAHHIAVIAVDVVMPREEPPEISQLPHRREKAGIQSGTVDLFVPFPVDPVEHPDVVEFGERYVAENNGGGAVFTVHAADPVDLSALYVALVGDCLFWRDIVLFVISAVNAVKIPGGLGAVFTGKNGDPVVAEPGNALRAFLVKGEGIFQKDLFEL